MESKVIDLIIMNQNLINNMKELENYWDSHETKVLKEKTITILKQASENILDMIEIIQPGYFAEYTLKELNKLKKKATF